MPSLDHSSRTAVVSEHDRPASRTLRASSSLAAIGDRPLQEPVAGRQVGGAGPAAASQAASKPEDSLARPIDLSARLLPAESIRPNAHPERLSPNKDPGERSGKFSVWLGRASHSGLSGPRIITCYLNCQI